jgi:GrpB-like predicted nucleotidyltransferase (UPF0157 family)
MKESQRVDFVESRFGGWAVRYGELEHIGSTVVPGLPAKDVVDVLVGVGFRHLLIADAAARAESLEVERAAARATDDGGEYTRAKAAVVRRLLDGCA